MKFILNYVNTMKDTTYLDKEFQNIDTLVIWVNDNHPEFTSYQVIFLNTNLG